MRYESQKTLSPGELLNDQGQLSEAGHATALVKRYDRARVRASKWRLKEWDYYCVCSDDTALALTIADNGYMGLDSVTLIDIPSGWQQTKSFIRVFPMGKTGLPATSEQGQVAVERKGYALRFENDGSERVLTVRVDDFEGGKPLRARVVLKNGPEHSMVIATPFAGKPKAFYYNQKINCLRASGEVSFGGKTRVFRPERDMGVLDWGRGVWTYKNTWYWGSASGWAKVGAQEVPFGMNLGYGFGDTSASTENMLFVNGRAHKLEHVTFDIPQTPDGKDDFLTPWRVTANDGRLRLAFTPFLDRASLTSAGVIESDQHQVFGYFDGTAVADDGTEIKVEHLLGFAEKVRNKW